MNIKEFMVKTQTQTQYTASGYSYSPLRPCIYCNDGQSVSVQASSGHYSKPREDGMSFYYKVEAGFPSVRPPETWREYFYGEAWIDLGFVGSFWQFVKVAKHFFWLWKSMSFSLAWRDIKRNAFADNACTTVYGYMPIEFVQEFIDAHGGIDEVKTFEVK